MNPFSHPQALRAAFEAGLSEQLARDGLGTFILATANASFEAGLWQRLLPALQQRFDHYRGHYRRLFRANAPLHDNAEDLLVFLKLALLGLEGIEPTRTRRAGPYELQFNVLRGFRPQRMSAQTAYGIRTPFDPNGFHFNRPFMEKEIFWEGTLAGRACALYFNKYPFVALHGLLVPERHARNAQFLGEGYHHYLWQVCDELGRTLPGVGFGYNSYGAYASVNHLHFQMFLREEPLPIADPGFHHNGGQRPYPLRVERFEDAGRAWSRLAELHRREIPYNLLYQPGSLHIVARKPQGRIPPPEWSGGMAWYEMAGGFLVNEPQTFSDLTERELEGALGAFGV